MTQQRKINRRQFLATVGAAMSAPYFIPSGVLAAEGKPGANERLTVALIGSGGRGRSLINEIRRSKIGERVQCIAYCDVDEKRLADAVKWEQRWAKRSIAAYRDYRYVLERKDIDAVVIGTPDHWHAVQTVHSAECGKHIYVEKPACCTIQEGKAMVRAAKENKVAVQVGSQGRSQPEAYLSHRYLVNGNIGHIDKVWCFHYNSPVDNNPVPDGDPPPELDWDMWLGPLRWRSYNKKYHHGVFRWIMGSGGGQIRDRGAHVMSCAKWWMGADDTGPVTIEATGTSPPKGLWDSAVTMHVTYTFKNPDWVLIWDQHTGNAPPAEERKKGEARIVRPGYGAVYHGSKGTFTHWGGDGGTWAERKAREWVPPAGAKDVYKSPGHMEDWFKGITTGAKTIMNTEAAVGVANLCILGNLSFILGRKLHWDQAKQEIVGDEEARRLMSRPQRHPYHL
ncbi:Gfo/Idh/MocA family oxidoreductase [bacterium]|nr:Gfo/Idh/MocA family oxidoreductase [bacterium]